MDDCADVCEPTGKNMQYGSPTPLEHSYQRNPFDFCFEQARKQNITHRYVPTISTINQQTSPLNTPSISLNEGGVPWIPLPLTTPMVGTSAIEVEPEPPLLQKTASLEEPSSLFNGVNKPNNNSSCSNNNQRSNVVSVICPPSAKTSDTSGNVTTRSAPVLTDTAASVGLAEDQTDQTPDIRLTVPKSAPELTCLRSYPRKNKPPLLAPITLPFLPLPSQEEPSLPTAQPSLPNSDVNHLITSNNLNNSIIPTSITTTTTTPTITRSLEVKDGLPPSTKGLSNLIKIVPKPATAAASSVVVNRIAKQLNISSLPPKRKEKSEEELLSRLKATEAALPPKAKPGRKSRTAAEEDAKERKKRSLERNRAAAMRCRLKKKKEIDELKIKVDEYEEQNNALRKIIADLCTEVRELKQELMSHKEPQCKESTTLR